jgi:hypothetical protein
MFLAATPIFVRFLSKIGSAFSEDFVIVLINEFLLASKYTKNSWLP